MTPDWISALDFVWNPVFQVLTAVLGAFAVASLRHLSLPTLQVLSRYVRPDDQREPGGPAVDAIEAPTLRVWVQNVDGVTVNTVRVKLGGRSTKHHGCCIASVAVAGGAGPWEPTARFDRELDRFIVESEAGMRPHATWRLEIALEDDFSDVYLETMGRRIRLGTADVDEWIGPVVGWRQFALLGALFVGLAALGWTALGGRHLLSAGLVIASVLILGWSALLYVLIRPVQAGIMSGWSGTGKPVPRPPAVGDTDGVRPPPRTK